MNDIPSTSSPPALSREEFRDLRCPKCRRLLLRVRGLAEIEIICHRCGSKIIWPNLALPIIAVETRIERILAGESFATGAPIPLSNVKEPIPLKSDG